MKEYHRVFLLIWEGKNVMKIKEFPDVIDAWKFIVESKIRCYSVYGAECIIDNSG